MVAKKKKNSPVAWSTFLIAPCLVQQKQYNDIVSCSFKLAVPLCVTKWLKVPNTDIPQGIAGTRELQRLHGF